MRTIDDTDREILALLSEDARRPFSDIADRVGLSAPAVSDRVDRLEEIGVIEAFTLRVDPGTLSSGVAVLVRIDLPLSAVDEAYGALRDHDRVDHAFKTADGDVVCTATLDPAAVGDLLVDALEDPDAARDVSVRLLESHAWDSTIGSDVELAIDCVECGNTVTEEGESTRIDGTLYHFCCGSCLSRFRDRYDRIEEGA
jgi:DNA-binding Lrp family transcriptional regulator/YHS domain-containing protein